MAGARTWDVKMLGKHMNAMRHYRALTGRRLELFRRRVDAVGKKTSCIQNSGGAGEVQFNVELGGGMMQKNSKRHHWPSGSPYRPGVSYQSLQIGLENYQMCLTIAKLDNVVYLSHSTGKIQSCIRLQKLHGRERF